MLSFKTVQNLINTVIICLILLLIGVPICFAGEPTGYNKYYNSRFSYEISYPHAILTPQGEPENGDGQRFLSKDGDVEMLVWGGNNALAETVKSRFQKESKNIDGRRVTFKQLKGNSYFVSGYSDDKVFYQKTTYLANDDVFISFQITYPADKKQKLDAAVTVISKSLRRK